jgi:hypothetical protein
MRLPVDAVLGKPPETSDWSTLQQLPETLDRLREQAALHNLQEQKKSKMWYDASHYMRTYEVGDDVLLYRMPSPSKFEAKWTGPVKVLKVYSNGVTYMVGDENNVNTKLVHVSRLAPYFKELHRPVAEREGVAEEAQPVEEKEQQQDRGQLWDIDRLIGRRSRRGALEYLVDWSGEWAPSWEPASALPEDLRVAYDSFLTARTQSRE